MLLLRPGEIGLDNDSKIRKYSAESRLGPEIATWRDHDHPKSGRGGAPIWENRPPMTPPPDFQRAADLLGRLRTALREKVIGQTAPIDLLLITLAARGHALLEGVPGLAKTTAVKRLGELTGLAFRRVQMTPDQLPADLTGAPTFDPQAGRFEIRKGPIFTAFLLADEINRAPPKVQSALLEAMEERQVTLGGETLPLPAPFVVFATQNPVEQDGTFPLPEAQLDRFLVRVDFGYPDAAEEEMILDRAAASARPAAPLADAADWPGICEATEAVRVDPRLRRYAIALARATRGRPDVISLGVSPRGALALQQAARARALLDGRDFAIPEDFWRLAPAVFTHRILLAFEAEAEGMRPADALSQALAGVDSP